LQSPSLDNAYQRAEGGPGTKVADNAALINQVLLKHNQAVASALSLPPSALGPDGTPAAPVGGRLTTSVGGGGGCGCGLGDAPAGSAAALALLLGLVLTTRARRQR